MIQKGRHGNEQVYVVPRRTLFGASAPHGFVPGVDRWLPLLRDAGRFSLRDEVEEDATLKQIIPYAVIVRGDEIFLFRRTDRGGERRLFGLRSIGVGGHVNPVDRSHHEDGPDVVDGALRRELAEEVVLPERWRARLVGLLNDDSTSVGTVHVGVVAVVEVAPEDEVSVREQDRMSGSFVGRAALLELHANQREGFESWSALLIDRFDEVLRWAPSTHDSSSPTPKETPTSST